MNKYFFTYNLNKIKAKNNKKDCKLKVVIKK